MFLSNPEFTMEDEKAKRRCPYWTYQEVLCLLEAIEDSYATLVGKLSSKVTKKDKERLWLKISERLVSTYITHHDPGISVGDTESSTCFWYKPKNADRENYLLV